MAEMKEDELTNLLNELSNRLVEPVRPALAEDIKSQIPQQIPAHRGGLHTVSIVINFRISRLAAAAAIIIAIFLLANFFGILDADIFQTIRYSLFPEKVAKSEMLAGIAGLHEQLLGFGKDVTYYGDAVDMQDANSVLMHWRLPDGKYSVVFSDLRVMTVSPDTLVILQARMLRSKTSKISKQ